jgi:hypothetical protein
MLPNVKYWLALVPVEGLTITVEGNSYWIDETLSSIIEKELGEATVLLSAGLWRDCLKLNYIKKKEKVFADSGGFQYYFLTPGRQKEFYNARDGLYRFQVITGDYVAGGDIPVGMELPRNQVEYLANLTKDNMEYQFGLDKDLGKRFINVMHGQSPENMEVWYSRVKDFPSAGWAVGAKGSGAFGNILQLMFLHEKGELTPGKLVHMFAMSGKYTINSVIWFIKEMGLDLIISSDSSSYSLGRYGAMWYKGGNLKYEEVRSGRVKLELWNGRIVTDIPMKMHKELYRDLMLTSVRDFCIWFRDEALGIYKRGGKVLDDLIAREEVVEILQNYREGGVQQVWEVYRERVPGVSEENLLGSFQVMENRNNAYKKKIKRKIKDKKLTETPLF